MKRSIFRLSALILALTLAAVLSGCGATKEPAEGPQSELSNESATNAERLSVVATVFPLYDFAREVGGDKVEVTLLLPPGADSHSYEPTAKDMATIEECDLFIYVGGDSEHWIDQVMEATDYQLNTLSLAELTDLLQIDSDSHGAAVYDEHPWTAPRNASYYAKCIREKLCGADPENEEYYRATAEAYIEKLDSLDRDFIDAVSSGKRDTLYFADRFPFLYLTDSYNLGYHAAYPGCSGEADVNPATIAALIDRINEEQIPVVFYIEGSDQQIADTICEATGATKLLLHSCHSVSAAEMEAGATYLTLMRQNLASLTEALA